MILTSHNHGQVLNNVLNKMSFESYHTMPNQSKDDTIENDKTW